MYMEKKMDEGFSFYSPRNLRDVLHTNVRTAAADACRFKKEAETEMTKHSFIFYEIFLLPFRSVSGLRFH